MSFLSKIQIRANKEPRGHFDFGKYASNLNLWVDSTEREPLKEISTLLKSKIGANAADGIGDHLGKFWLVLEPSSKSTIDDILTLTNIAGVMNLALGGLSITEVIGIYPKEQKAKAMKHAGDVLAKVKA